jgi:copper chaperone
MSTIMQIAGMSCNHCKMAVEKALQAVPGVEKVQVDLEKKQAVIEGKANGKNWSRRLRKQATK